MDHLKAAAPTLVALLITVLGPVLATTRLLAPLAGFGLMAIGGIALVVVSVVLLVRGVMGKAPRAHSLLLGGMPLLLVGALLLGRGGEDVPPINDISTDLGEPPTITVEGRPELAKHDLNYPAEFVEQVRQGYPDLASKTLPQSRDVAFARVDMRSRSRDGRSDLGVNAARIRGFFARL